MNYEKHELLKLAALLRAKAETSDSLAAEHNLRKEYELSKIETARAQSGRHYADVCEYFHDKIKEPKVKKPRFAGGFVKPTVAEVLAYAASHEELKRWPEQDIKTWYDHFEANGWLVGKAKAPMKDWQAAARTGFSNYVSRNPRTNEPAGSVKGKDPEGWRDFLKSISRQYQEWRYAPSFLRNDFDVWKKKK